MAIINYLRKLFKKQSKEPQVEYVEENRSYNDMLEPAAAFQTELKEMEHEIDLSQQGDLESYARGLNVTKESIERWISSGLLMPDEMKVAEKLVKIMRDNE